VEDSVYWGQELLWKRNRCRIVSSYVGGWNELYVSLTENCGRTKMAPLGSCNLWPILMLIAYRAVCWATRAGRRKFCYYHRSVGDSHDTDVVRRSSSMSEHITTPWLSQSHLAKLRPLTSIHLCLVS